MKISEIDGAGFFYSKEGRTDPLKELRATLDAFTKGVPLNKTGLHPQCAFPERYRYLTVQRGFSIEPVNCPKFEAWRDQFRPNSLTLIFASNFPEAPPSMFGHTFLRINAKQSEGMKKIDLLDFGINFAAHIPEDPGLTMAFNGLFGGYEGHFSVAPYYMMVNTYSHIENRDLWEFGLNVSAEELGKLIAHIWEIEQNGFLEYFFLDENCSYQLLTLLEVAKSDWSLTKGLNLYVLPADTIKTIGLQKNAVTSIHYRPSLYHKLEFQLEDFDADMRQDFADIVKFSKSPDKQTSPKLLDAILTYLTYKKKDADVELTNKDKFLLGQATTLRLNLPKQQAPTYEQEKELAATRPDISHNSHRFGLGIGRSGSKTYQTAELKPALHDLLNEDTGYAPLTQLDVLAVKVRYDQTNRKVHLDTIKFLNLTMISPFTKIKMSPSWTIRMRHEANRILECAACGVSRFEGGIGSALSFLKNRFVVTGMSFNRLEVPSTGEVLRVAPGVSFGLLGTVSKRTKVAIEMISLYYLYPVSEKELLHQARFNFAHAINQSWDLRFAVSKQATKRTNLFYQEFEFGMNHYF